MKSLSLLLLLIPLSMNAAIAQVTKQGGIIEGFDTARSSSVEPGRALTHQETDDLQWLVGRWRCVTRQYLTNRTKMLGSAKLDSLDYINVYFPYADTNLTLKLTDNPGDRPIAAEFLVRVVHHIGEFREQLERMNPGGPVLVGRNKIWYGFPPYDHYEFHYALEKRDLWMWLVLTSKDMRVECIKLDASPGDIRTSFVQAPIKDYSDEEVLRLKSRYAELVRSHAPKEPLDPVPDRGAQRK